MLISYLLKVTLDTGEVKVSKAADKKDYVLYTDGSKNPPKDAAGQLAGLRI